jgi:general secretion pathway protein C
MTAVNRVFAPFRGLFARNNASGPLPRSVLASAAVAGGWLLLNTVAYGELFIPSAPQDSLLADRTAPREMARQSARLPATAFFGRAPVESTAATPDIDLANIPITQLNLVLSGVLDSSQEDRASALVAERGKPAQRVFVGETLPGGARLHSVAVDHIVLERGGQMEKLTYPDIDGRPSVPQRRYSNYTPDRRGGEAAARSRPNTEQTRASVRERLEELRRLAKERRLQRQSQ